MPSSSDRKIDYVEFGVADIAKAKAFYGAAFSWTFTDYGPDYCEFSDGRLKGGFTTLSPVSLGGPLIVLTATICPPSSTGLQAPAALWPSRSTIFPVDSGFTSAIPTVTNSLYGKA